MSFWNRWAVEVAASRHCTTQASIELIWFSSLRMRTCCTSPSYKTMSDRQAPDTVVVFRHEAQPLGARRAIWETLRVRGYNRTLKPLDHGGCHGECRSGPIQLAPPPLLTQQPIDTEPCSKLRYLPNKEPCRTQPADTSGYTHAEHLACDKDPSKQRRTIPNTTQQLPRLYLWTPCHSFPSTVLAKPGSTMCDYDEFVFICGHSQFRLKTYCHYARNDRQHHCFGVKKLRNIWDQSDYCDKCLEKARNGQFIPAADAEYNYSAYDGQGR
ncbi:hypothetical protein P8C59_004091 [Phyllachora maydis]|uniref:Uncharacterized protein n=1 Tax=Phyllachora maydis TaxID=1825666 RepID=A0AAD9I2V1_9PEZI|nr:hypothetical protein P8C59_004091 [Phyllachora maydis]